MGTTTTVASRKRVFHGVLIAAALTAVFATPSVAEEKIHIHGFLSQGFVKTSNNNYLTRSEKGSFEMSEFALNLSATPSERLRIGLQLMGRDLGQTGNNEMYVDWAFADYQIREDFGLRIGKIKQTIGFFNDTRDLDVLRTTVLLPQGVYNESLRGMMGSMQGISIYGHKKTGRGRLEYELATGQVGSDSSTDVRWGLGNMLPTATISNVEAQNDTKYLASLRWVVAPDRLRLGFTWQKNGVDARATITQIAPPPAPPVLVSFPLAMKMTVPRYAVFSGEAKRGRAKYTFEYLEADTLAQTLPNPEVARTFSALYHQLDWQFSDRFRAAYTYETFYQNSDDRDGLMQVARGNPAHLGWQKSSGVALRFDVSENWVMKLEVQKIDGTAGLRLSDNPSGLTKDWTLTMLKATFSF